MIDIDKLRHAQCCPRCDEYDILRSKLERAIEALVIIMDQDDVGLEDWNKVKSIYTDLSSDSVEKKR